VACSSCWCRRAATAVVVAIIVLGGIISDKSLLHGTKEK
jgi:disulfide bond formation protein DsbB